MLASGSSGETTGSDDSVVRIWDVATGQCVATVEGHGYSVNCLAVLEDGTILCGLKQMIFRFNMAWLEQGERE